jgi:hypothetical protein
MRQAILEQATRVDSATDRLAAMGRAVFALAIVSLGVETLVCARVVSHGLGEQYAVIPVIPWLPAMAWLGYLFGLIWIACGLGFLSDRTVRQSGLVLGTLFFIFTIVLEVPKNAAAPGSMALRTGVFEPLTIACLAWLMPRWSTLPGWLVRAARYLLAISLIVFGVDHFLALVGIGTLLPSWIPWHVFWVAFFGAAFVAAGLSIALDILLPWAATGIGLMFAIWVFTLHLPRVLGLYGIPGAPHNPDEWSSLFIAVALWGGLWALAGPQTR